MVRSSATGSIARRAAALTATGTLAVLVTAGPALAQSAPAPRAHAAVAAAGVAGAQNAASQPLPAQGALPQAGAPALNNDTPDSPPPCEHEHHEGLLSSLLEGTGFLLGKLLGVLL